MVFRPKKIPVGKYRKIGQAEVQDTRSGSGQSLPSRLKRCSSGLECLGAVVDSRLKAENGLKGERVGSHARHKRETAIANQWRAKMVGLEEREVVKRKVFCRGSVDRD